MAKAFDGREFVVSWTGAGVEILSIRQTLGTTGLKGRIYRVRCDCCMEEGELLYESLYARVRKARVKQRRDQLCHACQRRLRFKRTAKIPDAPPLDPTRALAISGAWR